MDRINNAWQESDEIAYMHESRLPPCANARHSIENLISKKRPLLLKTAGQQRIVWIIKPAERLFEDLWACLCATKPIRCGCGRCDACDFLQRHRYAIAVGVCDWRLRVIMVGARCEGLFCKGSPRPIPRKRKRPVRTSGPKRELEARRGTGPHTRRGCTVLDLGRCTGTYCFGVAGKLGRGPRVCKAKV